MKNCHSQFTSRTNSNIPTKQIPIRSTWSKWQKQNYSKNPFRIEKLTNQKPLTYSQKYDLPKSSSYLKISSVNDLKKSIYPQSAQYQLNYSNRSLQQYYFQKNYENRFFNEKVDNLRQKEFRKSRNSQNISHLNRLGFKTPFLQIQKNTSFPQIQKNNSSYETKLDSLHLKDKLGESGKRSYVKQGQLFENKIKIQKIDLKQKSLLKQENQLTKYKSLQKNKHIAHLRYPSSYNYRNSNSKQNIHQQPLIIASSQYQQKICTSPQLSNIKFSKKRFSQNIVNSTYHLNLQNINSTIRLIQKLQLCQSQVDINVPSSDQEIQEYEMTARFNCNEDSINQSSQAQYKLQKSNTSLGTNMKNKRIRKICLEQFIIGPCKGKGRYGKVYIAFDKLSGAVFALKQVSLDSINRMCDQFISEIKLQSFLFHPYITKIYGYFVQNNNFYIIMEYMNDGSLYQLIKKQGNLSEVQSATKLCQVGKAISFMHKYEIIHRDIKPQNIVINFDVCKICDFSWATVSNQRRQTNCGTLDYLCPQIIQGGSYDKSIDLWCIGVLLYEMLVGKAPFYNISVKQTAHKIKQCLFSFPSNLSANSKQIIQCFLKKDPSQRKQLDQILNHEFFKQIQQ